MTPLHKSVNFYPDQISEQGTMPSQQYYMMLPFSCRCGQYGAPDDE